MAGFINKKIAQNINSIIEEEMLRLAKGIKDKPTLEAIGQGMVAEMKSMISKGISPIEGAGRFPEYKVKTKQRAANNAIKAARVDRMLTKIKEAEAKKLSKAAKSKKKIASFFGAKKKAKDYSSRGKQSALKARLLRSRARREQGNVKRLRAEKAGIKGYPYTVQKKFPAKKPRPVNLFLSGKFLRALKEFVVGTNEEAKLSIGFEDFLAEQIEEGHRVGWLGQGKRPIIPQGNERFAQRIQRVAEKILGQQLAKKLRAK